MKKYDLKILFEIIMRLYVVANVPWLIFIVCDLYPVKSAYFYVFIIFVFSIGRIVRNSITRLMENEIISTALVIVSFLLGCIPAYLLQVNP